MKFSENKTNSQRAYVSGRVAFIDVVPLLLHARFNLGTFLEPNEPNRLGAFGGSCNFCTTNFEFWLISFI
jgi:hypothetical protein